MPVIPIGKMVLNRNPDNYFQEIELAAFSPSTGATKAWLLMFGPVPVTSAPLPSRETSKAMA